MWLPNGKGGCNYTFCALRIWRSAAGTTTVRWSKRKGRKFLLAYRENAYHGARRHGHFRKLSCGYVGTSDGWTDLAHNFKMDWEYDTALDGNIALTGEIDLSHGNEFTLGVGLRPHAATTSGATLFQSLCIPFANNVKELHRSVDRTSKRLALMDMNRGKVSPTASSSVCPQHQSSAGPRGQALSRRHDCQHEHSLGRRQERRRAGRLSPGLDARHGAMRRRPAWPQATPPRRCAP